MNRTNIEWVRNSDGTQGYTSNPVRGECPVGCDYCYVKPFRQRYGWHKDIRFYPQELEAICKRKKPAGIFIGSTIELFHDKTIQYMPQIIDTTKVCPHHRIYLLTKQPQNLIKWSPFPDNCWVGVTVTDYPSFIKALHYVMMIEASVTYLSIEPLLGRIYTDEKQLKSSGIRQIIIGAMTGTKYELLLYVDNHYEDGECELTLMPLGVRTPNRWTLQPPISWVEEIVRACDRAGVKVFLKNNLQPLIPPTTKNILLLYKEYPSSVAGRAISLRQELPDVLPTKL